MEKPLYNQSFRAKHTSTIAYSYLQDQSLSPKQFISIRLFLPSKLSFISLTTNDLWFVLLRTVFSYGKSRAAFVLVFLHTAIAANFLYYVTNN